MPLTQYNHLIMLMSLQRRNASISFGFCHSLWKTVVGGGQLNAGFYLSRLLSLKKHNWCVCVCVFLGSDEIFLLVLTASEACLRVKTWF